MTNEITLTLTTEQAIDLREILAERFASQPIAHVHALLDLTEQAIETATEADVDAASRDYEPDDSMDGDFESGMASAGHGMDESYEHNSYDEGY
jgi:hypothetical protein